MTIEERCENLAERFSDYFSIWDRHSLQSKEFVILSYNRNVAVQTWIIEDITTDDIDELALAVFMKLSEEH